MTIKIMVLSVCVIGFSQSVLAADIDAGKQAAQMCSACHGVSGVSNNELWPNLAGQKAGYLVKQLKAFKEGTRSDPIMVAMSKALADDQIENVAAYYASLKP